MTWIQLNRDQLCWFVAAVTGAEIGQVRAWTQELEKDEDLLDELTRRLSSNPTGGSARPNLTGRGDWAGTRSSGPPSPSTSWRRALTWAWAPASSPRPCCKNGHGRLTTIDIDADAGYLIAEPWASVIDRRTGSSVDRARRDAGRRPVPPRQPAHLRLRDQGARRGRRRICGRTRSSSPTMPMIRRRCPTGPSGPAVTTCSSGRARRPLVARRRYRRRLGEIVAARPGRSPTPAPARGVRPARPGAREGGCRPARPARGCWPAVPPRPLPRHPAHGHADHRRRRYPRSPPRLRQSGSSIPRSPTTARRARTQAVPPGCPRTGNRGTDFPKATAGVVLPAGKHSYASYQLRPGHGLLPASREAHRLLPGEHERCLRRRAVKRHAARLSPASIPGINDAIDSNLLGREPVRRDDRVPDHREIPAAGRRRGDQPGLQYRLDLPVQHDHAQRARRRDDRRRRQHPRAQLHDPERPVRLPVLGRRLLGPRLAHRRPVQRHDRGQRDQLQRHLRLRGTA